jgi:hypothetical protein
MTILLRLHVGFMTKRQCVVQVQQHLHQREGREDDSESGVANAGLEKCLQITQCIQPLSTARMPGIQ